MNDAQRALEALPWDDILRQLRIHAERRMRRYIWQGRRAGILPEGSLAEDLVHDVVVKFLDGDRDWNQKRYPQLVDFLRASVDSALDHLANSWANRHLRAEATLSEGDRHRVSTKPAELQTDQVVVAQQTDLEAARHVTQFADSLADEPELKAILKCILEGTYLRRHLASELGISLADLDARRRRLQRRWDQFGAPKRRRSSSSRR